MRTIALVLLVAPLIAAGCIDAPAPDAETATAQSTEVLVDLETQLFEFDGTFGGGAWTCSPLLCEGYFADHNSAIEIDHEGELTGVTLTLTWDATSPVVERLRMGIMWDAANEPKYESVEGASPLVLDRAKLSIMQNDEPWFWVWVPPADPLGALTITTPVEFHAEGHLTLSASPSES